MRYVYFIGCGDPVTYVKIGSTHDTRYRLRVLQVGCPLPLSMLGSVLADDAERMEIDLHKRFASSHVRGEWFAVTAQLVDYISSATTPLTTTRAARRWRPRKRRLQPKRFGYSMADAHAALALRSTAKHRVSQR